MPRYEKDFLPILLEGQTATLFGTGLPEQGLNVKCIAMGALPEYWKDFGALTAGSAIVDQTDSNLQMNTMEMAQLRMRVITDMQVKLKNSTSVRQWRTKNTTFYLPQFEGLPGKIQEWYWSASEFFIWEDNNPAFDLQSDRAQVASIVLFSGYRYKFLGTKEPGKFPLWVSDWPSVSSTPRYPI